MSKLIEWREIDWAHVGLIGKNKFYVIEYQAHNDAGLTTICILEEFETGKTWKYLTLEEAKAKAEQLTQDWLLTVIKQIIHKCDKCGDSGTVEVYDEDCITPYTDGPCDCRQNPFSIYNITGNKADK